MIHTVRQGELVFIFPTRYWALGLISWHIQLILGERFYYSIFINLIPAHIYAIWCEYIFLVEMFWLFCYCHLYKMFKFEAMSRVDHPPPTPLSPLLFKVKLPPIFLDFTSPDANIYIVKWPVSEIFLKECQRHKRVLVQFESLLDQSQSTWLFAEAANLLETFNRV